MDEKKNFQRMAEVYYKDYIVLADNVVIDGWRDSNIKGVCLPDTAMIVKRYAFDNYRSLSWILLNPGLEVIEDYAFGGNSCESIDVPYSVKTIGEGALWSMTTKYLEHYIILVCKAATEF